MKFFVGLALAIAAIANTHAADSLAMSTTPASDGLDPEYPKIVCAAIMSWEECAMNLPERCRPKTRDPSTWEDHALLWYGPGTNESGGSANKQSGSLSQSSTCSDIYPDIYSPVCVSDGVKYSNPCKLKAAACKNPELNIVESGDNACVSSNVK